MASQSTSGGQPVSSASMVSMTPCHRSRAARSRPAPHDKALPAGSLRWGEAVLAALADGGFLGKELAIAFRTLMKYVVSAVQVEHSARLQAKAPPTSPNCRARSFLFSPTPPPMPDALRPPKSSAAAWRSSCAGSPVRESGPRPIRGVRRCSKPTAAALDRARARSRSRCVADSAATRPARRASARTTRWRWPRRD